MKTASNKSCNASVPFLLHTLSPKPYLSIGTDRPFRHGHFQDGKHHHQVARVFLAIKVCNESRQKVRGRIVEGSQRCWKSDLFPGRLESPTFAVFCHENIHKLQHGISFALLLVLAERRGVCKESRDMSLRSYGERNRTEIRTSLISFVRFRHPTFHAPREQSSPLRMNPNPRCPRCATGGIRRAASLYCLSLDLLGIGECDMNVRCCSESTF